MILPLVILAVIRVVHFKWCATLASIFVVLSFFPSSCAFFAWTSWIKCRLNSKATFTNVAIHHWLWVSIHFIMWLRLAGATFVCLRCLLKWSQLTMSTVVHSTIDLFTTIRYINYYAHFVWIISRLYLNTRIYLKLWLICVHLGFG